MIIEKKFEKTYKNFDREIVREIIDIFLIEYDERIEKLNTFLISKNYDELSKSAHAFKGVISNFETECAAYNEIAEIENIIRNYTKKKQEDDTFEDPKLHGKLSQIFSSFMKNSKQMYFQLEKMRLKFLD